MFMWCLEDYKLFLFSDVFFLYSKHYSVLLHKSVSSYGEYVACFFNLDFLKGVF